MCDSTWVPSFTLSQFHKTILNFAATNLLVLTLPKYEADCHDSDI